LALLGLAELPRSKKRETTQSILGFLAIAFGAPTYGRVLLEYTEEQVLELEKAASSVKKDK
jgi:hypothetical protein